MAECAVARCVQERRSFKKELQKWGKNVLFLAGLERVAEELVGREKWKRHMTPITDIDKKVVVDWEPDDLCCFCNGQKQPAPDPAKGVCTIDGLPLYNGATESDGNLSEDARLTPSPPPDQPLDLSMGSKTAAAYSSPHSPSADSGDATSTVLKVPQVPLKPGMKKRFDTAGCKRSYTDDELQAALRDIQSGKLGTRRAAVIYGIPRSTLRNKVYKLALERDGADGSRHSRSKAAAVAALSMEELVCNNGGLEATTSASESLRQLLRNRMAERAAGSKVVTDSAEHNDNVPSSSSTSSSLPFFSPLEYGQALAPLLSQVLANVNELALSKLRGSGGALSPEEAAASLSELPDECRLPFLSDLIRRLAEERLEEKRTPNGPKSLNSSPSLNGVNCSTAEDLSVTGSSSNNSASTTTNSSNNNSSPQNNVILKIPSYKPMKSLSNSSSGTSSEATVGVSGGNVSGVTSQNSSGSTKLAGRGIGVSLREIIAKSITQRVSATPTSRSKQDNKDLCNGSSDSSNQGFEEPLAKKLKCSVVSGSGKSGNTQKGGSKEQDKVASAGPAGAGGGGAGETGQQHHKPEKRTRPKRGRYRNYDRDNLAEAVRAVQRGEMSVHRAGSYYGVPHSTLEYKVKERHLLRPRKRDAKNKGNSGTPAATPTASAASDASGKIPPSQHSNSSTNSSSGASSQNGIKASAVSVANNDTKGFTGVGVTFPSHLPLWQSSPFFSLDFSQFSPNHFFASQMMRKLQEDALMHAETTSCSPGSSNKADSVSLLSSIIRSGLQAQVHAEAAISKAATRVAKDGTAAASSFSSTMVTGSHKVQDGDIPLNLSEAKVE